MMNPAYHFARMRELLDEYEPGRARSLAATKLDECEFWLANATPKELAVQRDQAAPLGDESRRDALDAQTLHDSPGSDQ